MHENNNQSNKYSVAHVITSLDDGGAEGVLFRLIEASCDQVSHSVISLRSLGKYGPMLVDLGVPVVALDMKAGRVSATGLWLLFRTLKSANASTVQTWMYHADLLGGVIAYCVGYRKIYWGLRNSQIHSSAKSTKVVAKICALISGFVPHHMISCSHRALEFHRTLGYRCRASVIPNGYDMARWTPDATRSKFLREQMNLGEQFVIGMVARFDNQKMHVELLEAAGILKQQHKLDFKLLLIGSGCDDDNLKMTEVVKKYGLEEDVLLLGQRNDVPVLMSVMDLHLLISRAEAFPNVLAEAMACGTPCISTDVGDAAEIIGDTGWILIDGKPETIVPAVLDAYHEFERNDHWEPRRIDCQRHITANFSLEKMVESYITTWMD